MSLGTLKCRSQVQQATQFLRQYVGEGVALSVRWDRTGSQNFPLLANADWSTLAIFGKFGRLAVSAADGLRLPVNSVGLAYSIDGDDISVDFDRVTFRGLARSLGVNAPGAAPGLTSFSVMTLLSAIRFFWMVLNPQASLTLGGNVSAAIKLEGESIVIDFEQMPSIHLVAVFRFNLSVRRVQITERKVTIHFANSSFIKSREFDIA